MNTTKATRRTTLAVGLALALGLGITAQASAGAPRSVSGKPSDNITRIADFYGAYIDAVSGHTGTLPGGLRAAYLTKALRTKLAAWEAREHADGVLRAQDVPVKWSVAADDSATGHVRSTVTLTWGHGPHPEVTRLTVVSDTHTHLITAITPTT